MITDLPALRAALRDGRVPAPLCHVPNGADKCRRLAGELDLELGAGRGAIETVEAIRETLVAFGALNKNDRVTDVAELIAALLPPRPAT